MEIAYLEGLPPLTEAIAVATTTGHAVMQQMKRESAAHHAFQSQLDVMAQDSGVGQEVIGMVLARTSLRAPNETSRWHLERGSDARPVDRRVLRQATVSKAVRALTKRGFLEEGERQLKSESEDGRRARSLESLRFGRGVVIAGVHVAQRGNVPKSITAVLVGLDSTRGLAVESRELATEDTRGWKGVAHAIHDLVSSLKVQLDAETHERLAASVDAADADFDPLLRAQREADLAAFKPFELFGVGVEVGAPVFDGAIASIARSVGATDVDYHGFEEELQDLFIDEQGNITPVVIENDVNALAVLAIHEEHYAVPDLVVVGVFDEGVGAGLVLDGRLRRGGSGTAMEIGHLQVVHVPGTPGAVGFQDQAPPPEGLPRTFKDPCECGRDGHVDTRATSSRIAGELGVDFDDAVDLDTEQAHETFRSAGFALGRAIAHVSNIVNPTRIIVYLPARLARPKDGAAAAEYCPAATAEICAAFGNAGRTQAEFLTYRPLAKEDTAPLCARAAAVCLLQGFIEHALRVDGCSFSTNRKADA
ncbi:ROK family protein [Mycobacterium hodleri]|uniref:ROK family protein n=1 Tax=Mycolicibacterium hodleri TaxID=49897 RepID=UPI0021F3C56E|nr:ROK family protein [Mycolicibacterium hodleri]MCV7137107.1 ROK family protein [Mycolicibacterium hodleri]